jgi:hypothetical protein
MTENIRKVHEDNVTPTFIVNMWDVRKQKLLQRGHTVNSNALSKRWAKHYFEGRVEHVQSGDHILFHSVSEFHAFLEKHRL